MDAWYDTSTAASGEGVVEYEKYTTQVIGREVRVDPIISLPGERGGAIKLHTPPMVLVESAIGVTSISGKSRTTVCELGMESMTIRLPKKGAEYDIPGRWDRPDT
jgi:hypothetical protein